MTDDKYRLQRIFILDFLAKITKNSYFMISSDRKSIRTTTFFEDLLKVAFMLLFVNAFVLCLLPTLYGSYRFVFAFFQQI